VEDGRTSERYLDAFTLHPGATARMQGRKPIWLAAENGGWRVRVVYPGDPLGWIHVGPVTSWEVWECCYRLLTVFFHNFKVHDRACDG
jgi:hypothetical protein